MNKVAENKEQKLIRELKQGSYKAFEQVYQLYAKRLYAYSLQFTKGAEDAEEIVQDVFVKLWQQRESIRQQETLRSLLFIMAKHLLINAYRARVNDPVYEDYTDYIHGLTVEDTHHRAEYNEFVRKIQALLGELPVTQQKVIRLSRFQQLSNREIAEKLALSEQTVKNQLSLGLKILKEKLDKTFLWFLMILFIN